MKTSSIKLLIFLTGLLMPAAAYANSGDIYVAENDSVRRYEPNGTAHVFASGLLRARGLAFDRDGNLYVATLDTSTLHDGRGRILRFAPNGTFSVFAVGLNGPEGLAFDTPGNLFAVNSYFSSSAIQGFSPLANAGNGRVTKIAPSGDKTVLHLDPTTYHQNFGVAIDEQNNLFVADNLQGGIYKISSDGSTSGFISIIDPIGLAFDSTGSLYTSRAAFGDITKIAPDGTQSLFVSGLGELRGLAFDHDGNLFAASPFFPPVGDGHNVVYKITPDGSVSIFASGLNAPQFIAVEP